MTEAIKIEKTELTKIETNSIETYYNTYGSPNDPPLLLVNGLGSSLMVWDEDFCMQLAAYGFWVIRYDNRDIGRATKFDKAGVPHVLAALMGQIDKPPYFLSDMAADGIGLLDSLGIEKAHVLGVSMGGMIVQEMLLGWPARLLTAVSIMSSTGHPELPQASPVAMEVLMTPSPTDRQGYIEHSVKTWPVIGSPGFPVDEARIRRRAALQYDWGLSPAGTARQMVAIIASGHRRDRLQAVTTPTLVIHGKDDNLVRAEGGIDTANSIPNAELMLIDGMGHNIPEPLWPQVFGRIAAHTKQTA
ncbi:MAG: alpha/beta hydrolase [Chloroflexota bacterium]